MGAATQIKEVLYDKRMKQTDLAVAVGKDKQYIYNALHRDSFSYEMVVQIADVLGCDVVLMDRETGKIY